ncbi:ScyD/ScyE family protein [Hymenobacter jejuensis]|uniref:ScyD/ScyE family protein n=1 Tax=Hymenobacter jejuensis TaxID=2502781 RepID=A0A5B7ZVU4_9BACT|nr:ScyD/ScyE family protein [Hymenobacter jejuensis]QDA58929.1 ScyD/ScyE family protein [Hymenobacter jejuensis]
MPHKHLLVSAFLLLTLLVTSCQNDDLGSLFPNQKTIITDDLTLPIGLSVDGKGRIWVSETGTGNNDAQISVVTQDGQVYPAFTGFASAVSQGGELGGIGHVLYKDGILYILEGGTGKLYRADVSAYKPGDPTRSAQSLASEDIGTFVRSQNLSTPIDSDIYDLTFGPDGDLYIADAGANAIIRRKKDTGALSVFAKIPNINPQVQSVPTGIVFDGNRFLVSTLTGFPFSTGAAKIVQVTLNGTVSDYRTGFTMLTNLALTTKNIPVVTEYAQFSLTPPAVGFVPKSGRVATETGTTLRGSLEQPTDIERVGEHTYYVLGHGDGTIQRLTY